MPDWIELIPEIVALVPEVPPMEGGFPGTMPENLAPVPPTPGSMGDPEGAM